MFRNKPDDANQSFIRKLYLPNEGFIPEEANSRIEQGLRQFEERLTAAHNQHQQHRSLPNLSHLQNNALRALKDHPKFIVVQADKNMGVCVMERDKFIKQVLEEHLDNPQVYQRLTLAQKNAKVTALRYLYHSFIMKHKDALEEPVVTFMLRGYKKFGDKISKFRATIKIHKNPPKTRPVVSKCGTYLECISKWLDWKLQPLMKYLPSVIRDGQTLCDELIHTKFPSNAKLFTADAVSMYTNIDLDHAMEVMSLWLHSLPAEERMWDFRDEIIDAILDGFNLVMRNNIFEFGDIYSQQLIGTAMGTSCAIVFANLYEGWHERVTILPRYKGLLPLQPNQPSLELALPAKPLAEHKRFIDDVFGVWIGSEAQFENFKHDLSNFGILTWDVSNLSKSVNFLDMTISIKDGQISTKTYQKENNPYLYITPYSAHPPGMIKGVVFGVVKRYFEQNSEQSDFIFFTNLFFQRLCARGWDSSYIKPIFIDAIESIQRRNPNQNNTLPLSTTRGQLFIHLIYHPCDVPRYQVRQIYNETLQDAILEAMPNSKMTVCYSRPKNIQDIVAQAALFQVEGSEASTFSIRGS
jgi:hypothetical protein